MAIVGFPELAEGHVYNAAAVLGDGAMRHVYRKLHLPNYGVFDERRYFTPGSAGRNDRPRRPPHRADRVRGPVAGRLSRDRGVRGRREPAGQHLRLALPRRQGARTGAPVRRSCGESPARTSRSARWSAARTSSCSTATPSFWTRPAPRSPAPGSSSRRLSSATSTFLGPAMDRRAFRAGARRRCAVVRFRGERPVPWD